MIAWVANEDALWSLFECNYTGNTSNIHSVWRQRTELWDDLRKNQRKTERERKMVPQKYAREFGGWDLFCVSCLGVGVWSKKRRGAGEFWGLIMYWPPKAPTPLPQYDDVTRETRRYGNLQSGFVGFIKHRCVPVHRHPHKERIM